MREVVRPGDTPDYSHIAVPVAHTPVRPDPLCPAHETTEHATRLIRVLRFSGEAKGDWAPEIPAETLRGALRDIALTRAMDERMFNMQRQGKMSFYMKSTGEEGVSVGHALALQDTDMIFPTYRQQGILIRSLSKVSVGRWQVPIKIAMKSRLSLRAKAQRRKVIFIMR